MPKIDSGPSALAPLKLLARRTAGELIPELVRHGLQQLIELEVAAVIGAERHERSEERLSYRNGYWPPGRRSKPNNNREAIQKQGNSCPLGWYSSGSYCVKSR